MSAYAYLRKILSKLYGKTQPPKPISPETTIPLHRPLKQPRAKKYKSCSSSHTQYKDTGRSSALVKQMFNVDGVDLDVTGKLKNSQKNQTIIHFNAPNSVIDRRDCGVSVRVRVPQTGQVVETKLIPQWRFGRNMRTNAMKDVMKGYTNYRVTEHASGDLVLEFL